MHNCNEFQLHDLNIYHTIYELFNLLLIKLLLIRAYMDTNSFYSLDIMHMHHNHIFNIAIQHLKLFHIFYYINYKYDVQITVCYCIADSVMDDFKDIFFKQPNIQLNHLKYSSNHQFFYEVEFNFILTQILLKS
jgi:hypothetical protein